MHTANIQLHPHELLAPLEPAAPDSVLVDGYGSMGVSVFEGIGSDASDIWVQLLPWSEYTGRPDANVRHQQMAHALGARSLVSIDAPGIGFVTSGMPSALRKDISDGKLDAASEIQWEAVRQAAQGELGSISLFGFSMGTALSASFIKNRPSDIAIDRVVLVEPVADVPISMPALGRAFIADALARPDYKKSNPEWFKKLSHGLPPQKCDLVTYSRMISHGGQFERLADALSDSRLTVVSGELSSVSTLHSVSRLAHMLNAEQVVLASETHSVIDNLARIAALSEYISKN